MNNITIPQDRQNYSDKDFYERLAQRKAENEQDYSEKYKDLKYEVIWTGVTIVLPFAVILLLVSSYNEWLIIKGYCMWYIQAVITLYVGSLLSKD